MSLLIEAAMNDQYELTESSLKLGFVSNHYEADAKITPLHFAAQDGKTVLVALLLEYGANPFVEECGCDTF